MLRTAALAFLLLATCALWCCRAARAESSALTDDEKARIEADRELRRKLSEAARKVEDQQKKWESERRNEETASSDEERKTADKARKKKEKEADDARDREGSSKKKEETASSEKRARAGEGRPSRSAPEDGRDRVNYAGHSVPASRGDEGGWLELGGVTRDARYGASNSGSSIRESGSGGTSIGVRATVIRLGEPDE